MRRLLPALPLVLLLAAAPTTPARAESIIRHPYGGRRPVTVDVHGVLSWIGTGFGGGFRVDIPIVHNGFVPTINNSVAITFGADLLYFARVHYEYTGLIPQVALQWNFFLTRQWSVFGEPGFAMRIPFDGHPVDPLPVFWAGGRYHFTERVALIMRATWYGAQVGVVF